jgi:integrase/recombinase XerD
MQRIRRRNKAIVKRREIDPRNKINHGITVNEALDIVIRIYESEGYRSRTINDYRKFWAELRWLSGLLRTSYGFNVWTTIAYASGTTSGKSTRVV